MQYRPKGECWDYDKNGNTYLTKLGEECHQNKSTKITGKYKGAYKDGEAQINNTIWSQDEAKTRYSLEQKENKSK